MEGNISQILVLFSWNEVKFSWKYLYEAGSKVDGGQKGHKYGFGRFFTKSCRSERPEGFWKL